MTKSSLIFLFILCLAFSLRCIYLQQTAKFIQPGCGSDSEFYLHWARDIVRGEVLGREVFYALPLYPYFLSLMYLFSGGEIFGLILAQILLGSINCGLIYILGKRLFNPQVGFMAAIFACGYSMFIFYDRMLLPASLAILWGLLLALFLLQIIRNPQAPSLLGAGILLACATLTSASFFLLILFVLFWIIFAYKKRLIKGVFLSCISFILPIFLIMGATGWRNYLVARDPVLLTAHSGINFYVGNNPRANGLFKVPPYMRPTQRGLIEDARIVAEKMLGRRLKPSQVSHFWFKRALDFIREEPLKYARLLGRKFVLFWNAQEYVDEIMYHIFNEKTPFLQLTPFRLSLLMPLALLGMLLARHRGRSLIILYFFIFAPMLGTLLFFLNSRYRLMVVPYLIIFAAFCLWRIFSLLKHKEFKRLLPISILGIALYFLTNKKAEDVSTQLNFSLHYNKGIYLSDIAAYAQAQEEFRAALKLNPLDFMSYLGLGNTFYHMRRIPEAIESLERALAINPYFYKAHFNLGIIYQEMGKPDKAEEHFRAVLALNPEYVPAHYNLGKILQERGLGEEALQEYQQALEISPAHPELLQAIEELRRQLAK